MNDNNNLYRRMVMDAMKVKQDYSEKVNVTSL